MSGLKVEGASPASACETAPRARETPPSCRIKNWLRLAQGLYVIRFSSNIPQFSSAIGPLRLYHGTAGWWLRNGQAKKL